MATRRPTNGRQVFVALDEVAPSLRMRVAQQLIRHAGSSTDPLLRCKSPLEALELELAARHPRVRPDGTPYGCWVPASDAARVRRGLYPVRVVRRRG